MTLLYMICRILERSRLHTLSHHSSPSLQHMSIHCRCLYSFHDPRILFQQLLPHIPSLDKRSVLIILGPKIPDFGQIV